MSSSHPHRIWYVVSPAGAQWQVDFGDYGRPFKYPSLEQALQVACGAAKMHWEDRAEPAGARLDLDGGDRRVLATYGRLPHVVHHRAAG
jgi:hypothetical protein